LQKSFAGSNTLPPKKGCALGKNMAWLPLLSVNALKIQLFFINQDLSTPSKLRLNPLFEIYCIEALS
jgi:hypothetical protein